MGAIRELLGNSIRADLGPLRLSFDVSTMLLRCLSTMTSMMDRKCIRENRGEYCSINNGSISKLRLRVLFRSMHLTIDFYYKVGFKQAGTSIKKWW